MQRPVESRQLSVWIRCSAAEVYRFAATPENLPRWAAGLARGDVERRGDGCIVQSSMGQIIVEFTSANDLGVLDHTVTLPGGERVFNPMRVVPAGPEWDSTWTEVFFTLRRRSGMSDAEYEADARAVANDLASLKRLMEADD